MSSINIISANIINNDKKDTKTKVDKKIYKDLKYYNLKAN